MGAVIARDLIPPCRQAPMQHLCCSCWRWLRVRRRFDGSNESEDDDSSDGSVGQDDSNGGVEESKDLMPARAGEGRPPRIYYTQGRSSGWPSKKKL